MLRPNETAQIMLQETASLITLTEQTEELRHTPEGRNARMKLTQALMCAFKGLTR